MVGILLADTDYAAGAAAGAVAGAADYNLRVLVASSHLQL
jgi:hypothetical protein